MKTVIVSVIVICSVVLGVYLFFITGAFAILMPKPPEPEIKYGEFPFCITYEVNGEIRTKEDVVICEYDGIENRGTAGKYRKWKARLKSGEKRVTLLQGEKNNVLYEITIGYGQPEYYMGDYNQDKAYYENSMQDDRYIGLIQWDKDAQKGCVITKEQALKDYCIKILDMEFAEPINNSFK